MSLRGFVLSNRPRFKIQTLGFLTGSETLCPATPFPLSLPSFPPCFQPLHGYLDMCRFFRSPSDSVSGNENELDSSQRPSFQASQGPVVIGCAILYVCFFLCVRLCAHTVGLCACVQVCTNVHVAPFVFVCVCVYTIMSICVCALKKLSERQDAPPYQCIRPCRSDRHSCPL